MSIIRFFDQERDITEIFPRLWQGCKPRFPEEIVSRNFEVIVFCEYDFQPSKEEMEGMFPGIIPVYCPFHDDYNNELSEETINKIEKTSDTIVRLMDEGKKILVVCWAGLNRSGLVVARTLNKYIGWSGKNCVEIIQKARRNSIHNPVFKAYAESFEGS